MAARADKQAVAFSEKVFERLLAAYPKAHREEYGAAMAQLFRDQCRDAWSESRGWGLTRLWLRVLPDVIGTSLMEHLEAIKERKFMLNRISTLFRSAHYFKFFTVFTAVFLLVVISVTLITFILPEAYVGTARINMHRESADWGIQNSNQNSVDPYFIQTQLEVIKSVVILGKVVENLGLRTTWGTKYARGEPLKTPEAVTILKNLIDLRPVRNTYIIEIRAYSDNPEEAAKLANATAEAYRDLRTEERREARQLLIIKLKEDSEREKQEISAARAVVDRLRANLNVDSGDQEANRPYSDAKEKLAESLDFQKIVEAKIISEEADLKLPGAAEVEILDRATPSFRPVRPNKPVNLAVGVVLGIVLGLIAGGGVAGISFLTRRNAAPKIVS